MSLQQLAYLYDASPPEVRKWMHENFREWMGNEISK
jgi:hypothetical protein